MPDAPSEDLWTAARDAYLSGATSAFVCRAFELPSSTFFKRAAQEGWLRRDQPSHVPAPRPLDLSCPVDDLGSALDKAWRRVCAALDAGDASAAARWTRVHAQLKASAIHEDRAAAVDRRRDSHRQSVDSLALSRSVARAAEAELALARARTRMPSVEKVESNSPDSTPDPDRPLNRAERRRLQRIGQGP